MRIFNRWGELVYETENPLIEWDGKIQDSNKPLVQEFIIIFVRCMGIQEYPDWRFKHCWIYSCLLRFRRDSV